MMKSGASGKGSMLFAGNARCRYCADAGMIVNGARDRSFPGWTRAIGGFVKGAKILMGRFARNQFESDLPCSASSG
jgi:hypothetical protein